jgi:hypothetical protein
MRQLITTKIIAYQLVALFLGSIAIGSALMLESHYAMRDLIEQESRP